MFIKRNLSSLHDRFSSYLFNHTEIFSGTKTSLLIRRYALLKMCDYDIFASNAYTVFEVSQKVFGRRFFSLVFRPFVYDLFIAGEEKREITQTVRKLYSNGILPLISPMLEDCDNQHMQKRNLSVINNSLELLSDFQWKSDEPKCLAIKLTAFFTSSHLEVLSNAASGESLERKLESLEKMTNNDFSATYANLKQLCGRAKKSGIVLLIDAEMSNLQPAVRAITMALMREYNVAKVTLVNTYQCYLKESFNHLQEDLNFANNSGFILGAKVVRGAYLESERKFSSAVFDSFEETSENYDRAVKKLLMERNFVIIATHNDESVIKAVKLMDELNLASKNHIYFAQINGMADILTSAIANTETLTALKLVPTGSVADVLPWLARRIQENRDSIRRREGELTAMKREIKSRLMT